MIIGGLQKLSMIDYPGKLSAIVFTKGCNFLCPFCHNAGLLETDDKSLYCQENILEFLKTRQGMLDAVSISGGEPLLQKDILDFLQKVQAMGFLVKLDTNGYSPEKLEQALPFVDYVAMDLKAPLSKYHLLAGKSVDLEKIKKSVEILKNFPKAKEFRTTLVHPLLEREDIKKIYQEYKIEHLPYYLQNYHPIPQDTLGIMWGFTQQELELLEQEIPCQIRNSS